MTEADKIMAFIRANPLSSNIQISKGTGIYPALVSSTTCRKWKRGHLIRTDSRPHFYAISKTGRIADEEAAKGRR
jgi:hypothetical protein